MPLAAEHIEAALTDILRNGLPNRRRSTGYCLVRRRIHHPPKYVLGLAHAHERNGREWRADEHYGGEPTNRVLRELGFQVIACTCRNDALRSN
jgi:hypothetical protein